MVVVLESSLELYDIRVIGQFTADISLSEDCLDLIVLQDVIFLENF